MTPREKAVELLNKFSKTFDSKNINQEKVMCKQSSIILCNEILDLFQDNTYDSRFEYYMEVKSQIQKL